MAKSTPSAQKWIPRNRPPRVQIEYDVETGGATKAVELPWINGVMSDLTGRRDEEFPELEERGFSEVDIDNFDSFMKKQKPRVGFAVENALTDGGGRLDVDVTFESLDDFSPDELAKRVGAEIEDIVVTEVTEGSQTHFEIAQEGEIATALGAQIPDKNDITAELVALRAGGKAEEYTVDQIPDLRDPKVTTIRVTKKGPLAMMVEARKALDDLIARADGKAKAEDILTNLLNNEKLMKDLVHTNEGGADAAAPAAEPAAPAAEAEEEPAPEGDE